MAEGQKVGGEREAGKGKGQAGWDQQAARPSSGHPASWQHLPVTSWQGRGDGEMGGEGHAGHWSLCLFD